MHYLNDNVSSLDLLEKLLDKLLVADLITASLNLNVDIANKIKTIQDFNLDLNKIKTTDTNNYDLINYKAMSSLMESHIKVLDTYWSKYASDNMFSQQINGTADIMYCVQRCIKDLNLLGTFFANVMEHSLYIDYWNNAYLESESNEKNYKIKYDKILLSNRILTSKHQEDTISHLLTNLNEISAVFNETINTFDLIETEYIRSIAIYIQLEDLANSEDGSMNASIRYLTKLVDDKSKFSMMLKLLIDFAELVTNMLTYTMGLSIAQKFTAKNKVSTHIKYALGQWGISRFLRVALERRVAVDDLKKYSTSNILSNRRLTLSEFMGHRPLVSGALNNLMGPLSIFVRSFFNVVNTHSGQETKLKELYDNTPSNTLIISRLANLLLDMVNIFTVGGDLNSTVDNPNEVLFAVKYNGREYNLDIISGILQKLFFPIGYKPGMALSSTNVQDILAEANKLKKTQL